MLLASAAFLFVQRESELDVARRLTLRGVGHLVEDLQSTLNQAELTLVRLEATLAELPAGQDPAPALSSALAYINPLRFNSATTFRTMSLTSPDCTPPLTTPVDTAVG